MNLIPSAFLRIKGTYCCFFHWLLNHVKIVLLYCYTDLVVKSTQVSYPYSHAFSSNIYTRGIHYQLAYPTMRNKHNKETYMG